MPEQLDSSCSEYAICPGCNVGVPTYCSNCLQGIDCCCECYYCQSCCAASCGVFYCSDCEHTRCGRLYEQCSDCSSCQNCCTCDDEEVEGLRRRGSLTFYESPTFKINPSRRYIALEVELALCDRGIRTMAVCDAWNNPIVADGSLPNAGFEINTNPTNGDLFSHHVAQLAEALSEDGAKVTSECGMHCHVDASDYTPEALYRLIKLYQYIEPVLFGLVYFSRRYSPFCIPVGDIYASLGADTFAGSLVYFLYNFTLPEPEARLQIIHKHRHSEPLTSDKYNRRRYLALNLHSLFYRGTVEFRHHHGTISKREMANWGMLCAAIVDYAFDHSDEEIAMLETLARETALAVVAPHLTDYITTKLGKAA